MGRKPGGRELGTDDSATIRTTARWSGRGWPPARGPLRHCKPHAATLVASVVAARDILVGREMTHVSGRQTDPADAAIDHADPAGRRDERQAIQEAIREAIDSPVRSAWTGALIR